MAADFDNLREHIMRSLARIEAKLDAQAADMVNVRERVAKVEVRALGLASAVALVITVILDKVLR